MQYVNSTKDHILEGYVGDTPDKISLTLYCDADFASDKLTRRSTSAMFLALAGDN